MFGEHKAGARIEEICRRHGVSSGGFNKLKARYGGLEVSDVKWLKGLVELRDIAAGGGQPVLRSGNQELVSSLINDYIVAGS